MVRGKPRWRIVTAALVAALAASCAPAPGSGGGSGPGLSTFDAGATDPDITSEPLYPSFSYNPGGEPRGELVVLFNGTGAGPLALSRLGGALASVGFHVIGLRYESAVGTLSACPDSARTTNPDCHRQFRGEIVHGAGVPDPDGAVLDHSMLDVDPADSVVNRLIKHVEYLDDRHPTKGWSQFQQSSGGGCVQNGTYGGCQLRWDRVVALGHSQGAGVALYLGKHYPLDRVGMLSGAYDAFGVGGGSFVPAPWVAEGGFELPVGDIATFSHTGDPAIGFHRAVADAVGIPGSEVLITADSAPYGYSGRLLTDAAPVCLLDSAPSHNSTATDGCAPVDINKPVWRYLAIGG